MSDLLLFQAPQKLKKCKETVPITNEKTARSLIVAGRRRPFLRLQGDEQDTRLSDAGSVPRGPGGHGGA